MADNNKKKIVLITGGNTGIGYETVKALLQSSQAYLVLMGSRSLEKAKAAIEQLKTEVPQTASSVEALQIDVASDESIEKAFETVKASYGHIDSLINNAGGSYDHERKEGKLTLREAWNKTFDVNVSGTYVMTHVFLPLLIQSADPRLLFITSGLSSLTRTRDQFYPLTTPPAAGWPKKAGELPNDHTAYRSSKTALNMMMLNLRFLLSEDGVKTWSVSPGFLATGLANAGAGNLKTMGAGHPSIGGNFIRDVVEGKRDTDEGMVVFNDGSVQPW
ncbi:putative short chain protein [Eutypa lata UCREL1]|uniref:Putative short chain protein n=1 Tax=Eutypa lata (strain UCR-EL1) TaxID=1287681 RepID=M7SH04_EUTLA|nr:putative short chain protein [Eutypa lata UCREL1]